MLIYPLKAIITTNEAFAAAYNSNSGSLVLTSGCLTPEKAKELLSQGANFQAIISVDGQGEEIIGELITASLEKGTDEGAQIERIYLNPGESPETGIKEIHGLFKKAAADRAAEGGG